MKWILKGMTVAWHGCAVWVVTSLGLCLVACGGGTSFDAVSQSSTASAASVATFLPSTAVATVATTFTVTGTNFPQTVSVTLSGGSCASPTGVTAGSFSVVCVPGASTGAVYAYVNTAASGGWWIGQQSVTVTPAPSLFTDTGISANQCYAAGSDALVSCASAGAIALSSMQDGMAGRDAVANVDSLDGLLGFSYSAVGTSCIQDKVTGLIWQNASATLNYVIAAATNPIQQAFDSVAVANAAALCGFSDWRLPYVAELQGLLHYGATNIAVDMNWLGQTKGTGYLSGSPYFTANREYWTVDFAQGKTGSGAGITGLSYELRLVRGVPAAGALTPSADGTEVTDSRTGLIWQRCTVGQSWNGSTCVGPISQYSHELALAFAKAPWRVPNVKELSSLVGGSLGMAIDGSVFVATQPAGYWTSTPDVRNPAAAWGVSFSDGSASPLPRSSYLYLRLVR